MLKSSLSRFCRWDLCSLCEQDYHGVVRCALGWACWKTYVGRPEADQVRHAAISVLGAGLQEAKFYEDALSVRRGRVGYEAALWPISGNIHRTGQSREHV